MVEVVGGRIERIVALLEPHSDALQEAKQRAAKQRQIAEALSDWAAAGEADSLLGPLVERLFWRMGRAQPYETEHWG